MRKTIITFLSCITLFSCVKDNEINEVQNSRNDISSAIKSIPAQVN